MVAGVVVVIAVTEVLDDGDEACGASEVQPPTRAITAITAAVQTVQFITDILISTGLPRTPI